VGGAANANDAGGSADVKNTDFAALEEEGAAEFLVAGRESGSVVGTAAPQIMRSRSV
jgi:hypothetical protein